MHLFNEIVASFIGLLMLAVSGSVDTHSNVAPAGVESEATSSVEVSDGVLLQGFYDSLVRLQTQFSSSDRRESREDSDLDDAKENDDQSLSRDKDDDDHEDDDKEEGREGEDEFEDEDGDDDNNRDSGASVNSGSGSSSSVGSGGTSGSAGAVFATFTMSQVAAHITAASCYSAINGNVYDLTQWIPKHPGGQAAIKALCGVDGTVAFNDQHGGGQQQAKVLATFKIGTLVQ